METDAIESKKMAQVKERGRHSTDYSGSDISTDKEPDPSQVAVLPAKEWERIQGKFSSWCNPAPSRNVLVQRKNESLHRQSTSIVKHWENTIEGQRLKRLEARKLREDEEERKRVEIDEEEASFQAQQRKEAIKRAKTLLYYQTDRVKKLNGALVLSEVLRERDAQILHKKKRQNLLKKQDDLFVTFQEKERECANIRDQEAAEERARKKSTLAQYHLKQSDEKVQKKLEDRLAALEEQKRLNEEVLEQQLHQKELNDKKTKMQEDLRQELDMVVDGIRKVSAAEKQRVQIEEEQAKLYTKAKKQMEKLRKERQVEVADNLQAHQQLMCDNLQKHKECITGDEDQRIAQTVQKQIAKRDAEIYEKHMKHMAAVRDIHKHGLEQMAAQEQKMEDQKKLEQEMFRQRIINDQKFHDHQLEKQKLLRKEAIDLQQFHTSQMAELKARNDAEKLQDLTYNRRNIKLLEVEERQFKKYANKTMSEVKERGGQLQPLVAAAKEGAGGGHGPVLPVTGVRPSYKTMDSDGKELPSYTGKNIQELRKDTQKRLGFIW